MDAQLGMRLRQVEVADRPLKVWEEFDVSMSPGMLSRQGSADDYWLTGGRLMGRIKKGGKCERGCINTCVSYRIIEKAMTE